MDKNFRRRSGVLCALVLALVPAYALADPPGSVILARAGSTPLVIWDASPAVAGIVQAKTADDRALHDLEVQAADVAVTKFKALPSAKNISVRVVYQRTGAVSATYGSATFTGVENLLTVSANRADALGAAKALGSGPLPVAFSVTVTGKLPPH